MVDHSKKGYRSEDSREQSLRNLWSPRSSRRGLACEAEKICEARPLPGISCLGTLNS